MKNNRPTVMIACPNCSSTNYSTDDLQNSFATEMNCLDCNFKFTVIKNINHKTKEIRVVRIENTEELILNGNN
jgi:C4-type Zn-finger protein